MSLPLDAYVVCWRFSRGANPQNVFNSLRKSDFIHHHRHHHRLHHRLHHHPEHTQRVWCIEAFVSILKLLPGGGGVSNLSSRLASRSRLQIFSFVLLLCLCYFFIRVVRSACYLSFPPAALLAAVVAAVAEAGVPVELALREARLAHPSKHILC